MRKKINIQVLFSNRWFECICFCLYKLIIDFIFIPNYYEIFGYLTSELKFNFDKWFVSNIIFSIFLIILVDNKKIVEPLYIYAIRFLYLLCVIPVLSVYAFRTSSESLDCLFPSLYYLIIVIIFKQYAYKENNYNYSFIKIPPIQNIDKILPIICGGIAIFIWAYAGFPIILDLSETRAQRLALRAESLPTILSYIFMLLGGTMFPFFTARFIDKHQYAYAAVTFIFGIILFFVNGMKTWLFLYIFIIGMYIIYKYSHNSWLSFSILFEIVFLIIPLLAVWSYKNHGSVTITSQFSRIILVPSSIGFKSMSFFKNNELLYLRESILRRVFSSPYVGGSDFYMNYGSNISLTSSRSNNGLWGDAYRNFGFLSIFFYPVIFSKTIRIIVENCKFESLRLSIFIVFLMIWGAINVSFFTWLITGGVVIIILLLKAYRSVIDEVKYNEE